MKYRSTSPGASLPTPPCSPRATEAQHSAVNLLDSLTAFYQQERYWVHHTRAALELALTKGIDAPPTMGPGSPYHSSTSETPSSSSAESDASATPTIKSEPESTSLMLTEHPASSRKSLWMRRKAGMKLKLDGLSHSHRRRRPHRAPPTEPGPLLLEMFSELVDARMESCQRVSRLLRESSNRPTHCVC